MATTTANLGLTKPDYTEAADIAVINNNMDLIDTAVQNTNTAVQQRDRVEDLLINGNFVNSVNQRGRTSYTGNVYGIDRWIGRNALQTLEVRGPDVTITANSASSGWPGLRQKIANIAEYAGKTVTFAVRLYSSVGAYLRFTDDSNANLASSAMGANKTTDTLVLSAVVPDDATPDSFFPDILLAGTTSDSYMRLYWAALYVGEYTAETLPTYVPKGYAHEWQECRRYYQYHGYACVSMIALSGAKVLDSTYAFLDGSMRTIPAVTGTLIRIYGQGTANESPDSGYTLSFSGNSLRVSYPSAITNVTTLQIYGVYFSDLAFDAEL